MAEAVEAAERIGYPVLVRPSYVLGGRGMEIVYDQEMLREYFTVAASASPEHPVLLDRFLEDAFEADVDAVSDGESVLIGGVMQHIEEAGIHSGDSFAVQPFTVAQAVLDGVAERVAEVQDGSLSGLALVFGDDFGFQLAGAANRERQHLGVALQQRSHVGLEPVEEVAVADRAILDDLGHSGVAPPST